MIDVILDALIDTVKLIPFLFVTYLLMEYMEHKAGGKIEEMIRGNRVTGPIMGALFGVFPQCGFSAAASNFYAGRLINVGTLLAVFLSTSDEMLPILLAAQIPVWQVVGILTFKIAVGIVAGIVVNYVWHLFWKDDHGDVHDICEQDHCHCEHGIVRSALHHTVNITLFVLLFCFVLNTLIYWIGEETLAGLLLNRPVIGPMITALVGLVPNCAASILITQMYLNGLIDLGTMLAGVLAGAGIGIAVLFRVNRHWKQNATIIGILYVIGAGAGILVELLL